MGLPNIGPIELIIILAVLLLVVGPRRLPEMGQAVGKTIREFRKASTEITDSTTLTSDVKKVSPAAAAPVTAAASGSPAPVSAPAAAAAPATDSLAGAPLTDVSLTDAPAGATPLPPHDPASEPGADTTDDPSLRA